MKNFIAGHNIFEVIREQEKQHEERYQRLIKNERKICPSCEKRYATGSDGLCDLCGGR